MSLSLLLNQPSPPQPYPFSLIPSHSKSHLLPSHYLCASSKLTNHSSDTTTKGNPYSVITLEHSIKMATLSPATITATATTTTTTIANSRRRKSNVHYITGLNSFGGLKAHNNVASVGLPVCTEQSFAKVVSSLKLPSQGKGRAGGALSSTCNAAGEIFTIAAIMNGLVLVGVAVGFVLLRIEAFVEEAE